MMRGISANQLNKVLLPKTRIAKPKNIDQHGFSEASLKTAWRNQTNQEVAASIVAFIRQATLGEPLIPFEQRVEAAMASIFSLHD